MALLGLYDLKRYNIYIGNHDDPKTQPVTARHEYIHQLLTKNSTYGDLIIEAKNCADATNRTEDNELFEVLLSKCVNIQESVATYDSLNFYGRTDLLSVFPKPYIEQFNRMENIVSRHFSQTVARNALAFAVGRCAMLSSVKNLKVYQCRYSENVSPEYIVSEIEAPDSRYSIIEKWMEKLDNSCLITQLTKFYLPLEELEKFLAASHQEEFFRSEENRRISETAVDSLVRILCNKLESVLPGIEDARSENACKRGANRAYFAIGSDTKDFDLFFLREVANQRPVLYDLPDTGVYISRKFTDFEVIMENTIGEVGAVFAYLSHCGDEPIMYIANLPTPDCLRDGKIMFYELDRTALSMMSPNHPLRLTLSEEDTLAQLHGGQFEPCIRGAIHNDCLIHIDENPIDFMIRSQDISNKIGIWFFQFCYDTGVIKTENELFVVIYILDDFSAPRFHLASPPMLDAIDRFKSSVNKSKGREVFSLITPQEAMQHLGPDTARRLIEHPVFGSFYLNGCKPIIQCGKPPAPPEDSPRLYLRGGRILRRLKRVARRYLR